VRAPGDNLPLVSTIDTRSPLVYTRCALAGAIAMTLYALWQRLPEMTTSRMFLYLVVLFPYAFLAMIIHSNLDRRLLAWVRGGSLLFVGLWAWAALGGTQYGPSTYQAVIFHVVLGALVGIPAVMVGKRTRRAASAALR
jgi:hypothetical protein